MIEDLSWDTNFFNFNVGKIELINDDSFLTDQEMRNVIKSKYKLLYFFIDPLFKKSAVLVKEKGGYLTDEKVTFRYDISETSEPLQHQPNFKLANSLTSELIKLTLQSGLYSRFKNDKNIPTSKFEELYTIWIMNSFKRDDIKVFEYFEEKILKGFITLRIEDKIGVIELIAVDNSYRSEGIGTKLIDHIIYYSTINNFNSVFVNTQKMNIPACNFYKKNNFKFDNQINIYHLWNLDY